MNDNTPRNGRPPAGFVRIVGVVTDGGRVILTRPLPRPSPRRPALHLVKD